MSLGKRLDEAEWRQGRVVQIADHGIFGERAPEILDGDRLIVISQSCDVIKQPDDAEPAIELIVGRSIDALQGNYTYNKNSRILHTALQTTSGDFPLSLLQNDKFVVDRVLLDGLTPDADVYLEREQINTMARWLASRYDRPAFPNEFNRRIDAVKRSDKKMRNAAKKISAVVSGLFVNILPFRELDERENYSVNILALVPAGQDVDIESSEITGPVEAIANIMRAANMDVECQIRKEDQVPYSLFRNDFKPWDFDDISLRGDPPHETP